MKQFFTNILQWIIRWFWEEPVKKDPPLKATDVSKHYVCIRYKNQLINLHKSQLKTWNNMPAREKREILNKTKALERKGKIKFIKINGKMICVKNKNYESKADVK